MSRGHAPFLEDVKPFPQFLEEEPLWYSGRCTAGSALAAGIEMERVERKNRVTR